MMCTRKVGSALAAVFAITALAACGGQSGGTTQSHSGVVEVKALHDALPASVRSRGTLRILTDASYAPASSFASDGRTIIGFEPDLGAAIGAVLGVKVTFADKSFDSLIGAVRANPDSDLLMSAMTDTADREKQVDFVNYFTAGTSIVVQRGNPHGVSDLDSLCGLTVAVESGTVQADLLKKLAGHCVEPMRVDVVDTNDAALLELRTGRAAAVPMDYPPAEHLTSAPPTSDQYQLASTAQYEPAPYGIGVAKTQVALSSAVRSALATLMRTGAYQRILARWHVSSGALQAATINSAGGAGPK